MGCEYLGVRLLLDGLSNFYYIMFSHRTCHHSFCMLLYWGLIGAKFCSFRNLFYMMTLKLLDRNDVMVFYIHIFIVFVLLYGKVDNHDDWWFHLQI